MFFVVLFVPVKALQAKELKTKELWHVHSEFENLTPGTIAVLPMENFSLETDINRHLYNEVYKRLQAKGYKRISIQKVDKVMQELGIQVSGQLAGISLEKLKNKLNCDAVLRGRVDQSADIHQGVMDAIVVSCSLRLIHCETGKTLWQTEQWRAAHRQFQIDPINALINLAAHKNASRKKRIAWLVQEMFKTLPEGHVQVEFGNLLDQAVEVKANE